MSSSTIGTSPRARHHPVQKAALQTGSAAFSLCTGISIRRALLPRQERAARIASVALLCQHSGVRQLLKHFPRPSSAQPRVPATMEALISSCSSNSARIAAILSAAYRRLSAVYRRLIGSYWRSIGDSSIMATQSSLTIPRFTYSSAIVSRGWESIARWQISLPSRSRRPRRLPVQPSRGLRHRQLRSGS